MNIWFWYYNVINDNNNNNHSDKKKMMPKSLTDIINCNSLVVVDFKLSFFISTENIQKKKSIFFHLKAAMIQSICWKLHRWSCFTFRFMFHLVLMRMARPKYNFFFEKDENLPEHVSYRKSPQYFSWNSPIQVTSSHMALYLK